MGSVCVCEGGGGGGGGGGSGVVSKLCFFFGASGLFHTIIGPVCLKHFWKGCKTLNHPSKAHIQCK